MIWNMQTDGDINQLIFLVEQGWDFQFPGWKWVADSLNNEFGTSRSASACRLKYWSHQKDKCKNKYSN